MAPNNLFTIDNARSAAAVRPELKIAARSTQEQPRPQAPVDNAELLVDATRRQSMIDALRKQLATEVAARLRSESERDVVQGEVDRLRAESDAQKAELSLAWQQLDIIMAERSKLIASFELERRAMFRGTTAEPEIVEAGADPTVPSETATPVTLAEAYPEIVEDVKAVLEQVKAIYDLDVGSDRSSADLVDSLTTRLRQAREVIVARSSISERDTIALFEEQIDALLDSSGGNSFGRHLSISAYAASGPAASTRK